MSVLDKFTYMLGKAQASHKLGYLSIAKQFPAVSEPSAWVDPQRWGEALHQGEKPKSKAQFIEQFTSWVYICTKLNAQTVATNHLRLYVAKSTKGQKFKTIATRPLSRPQLKSLYANAALDPWLTKAAEVEEVTEHAFLDLMKGVNDWMNNRDLKELTTMYADLTGEAYWWLGNVSIKGQTIPQEIWPIPSQYITPIPGKDTKTFIAGYKYARGNVEQELSLEEVIHFPYPNPKSQYVGFSCVAGVADAVFVLNKMYAFEEAMFKNKGRTGGILTMEEGISEAEKNRLQLGFQQKYAGASQSGKTVVLPKGMKWTKDTMTPEEMSFIEGRKLVRDEICLAFDVPPSLFAIDANRETSKTGEYRHAKYGIMPRCERYSEKINEKLLPMYDEKLFCTFDNIVPKDKEEELKEDVDLVNAGIVARNEIREERGLEPIEGGDDLYIDSRLVPIGQPPPEQQAEQLAGAFERALKAKVRKLGEGL